MAGSEVFFSIVIPTYNAGDTLAACLDSIIAQSFSNFEILIVDGLSTDNSRDIATAYQDDRIRFVSEKDKGIYDAMNKGIKLAKGEWIYFIGSDDKLYDEKVLANVAAMTDNNFDVLYGDVYSKRFNGIYDKGFTIEKIYGKNICHQAIFLRKRIFSIVGNYDTRFRIFADWDHNLKWFLHAGIRKKYIDLVIADYADNGFSSTNSEEIFFDKKDELFIKYGKGTIDKRFRVTLYGNIAWKSKGKKRYLPYLKYRVLYLMGKYLNIAL